MMAPWGRYWNTSAVWDKCQRESCGERFCLVTGDAAQPRCSLVVTGTPSPSTGQSLALPGVPAPLILCRAAMGSGRILGAGAVLVALVVLGARPVGGEETKGFFQEMAVAECHYLNGTERVRFLERRIYNQQQNAHFDSNVGHFVADTELGKPDADYWNSQPEALENARAAVDRFCRHNYEVSDRYILHRRVEPKVRVSPMQSSSLPQTDRLACYVTGFYPAEIQVKWFKNGQEETKHVVSTDVIQNGDWTYQVLVMLESTPQHGDTYECHVQHASLKSPITYEWVLPADAARGKMLTGVGGLVLGLIFLALGLFLYVRRKVSGRGAGGGVGLGGPRSPPALPLTWSRCVAGRIAPPAAGLLKQLRLLRLGSSVPSTASAPCSPGSCPRYPVPQPHSPLLLPMVTPSLAPIPVWLGWSHWEPQIKCPSALRPCCCGDGGAGVGTAIPAYAA
uniref:Ig-like domain-containing protein n=1 Tax=Anas platyrhynchos TaxID=8839 RepID=A0A8B9R7W1_ANAPL